MTPPADTAEFDAAARDVVRPVSLQDTAACVDGVHKQIATGGNVGHIDVLAVQVRAVVVTPADRDPLGQAESCRFGEATSGQVCRRVKRCGRSRLGTVTITETEAAFAITDDADR